MPSFTTSAADRDAIIRTVFATITPPVLTRDHLVLIRQLRVMWLPIESGAPAIDFWQPLLSSGPTVPSAMAALQTDDGAHAVRVLAELGRLLPAFVCEGAALAPGSYPAPDTLRLANDPSLDPNGNFTLRDEHLLMLKAANWRTVESNQLDDVLEGDRECWPMPYVDGKHPYGDFTHFELEMADLLGEPYDRHADGSPIADEAKDLRMRKLHEDMLPALQIFLMHAMPTQAL